MVREDTVTDLWLAAERTYPASSGIKSVVRIGAGWREQQSSLDYYDLSGPRIFSSLSVSW